MAEIAELSDKVTFKEDNSLPVREPFFLITNPGSNQGPRFAGSPLGHEFTSLVLALLWTGGVIRQRSAVSAGADSPY